MKDNKLTVKQEKFAKLYLETGNASLSYRQSYEAENMKPNTVEKEALALKRNPKVSRRIEQLQQEHAKRHNITVDSICQELEDLRLKASDEGQFSAAVTAVMGKAKLHGLDKIVVDTNQNVTIVVPTEAADI